MLLPVTHAPVAMPCILQVPYILLPTSDRYDDVPRLKGYEMEPYICPRITPGIYCAAKGANRALANAPAPLKEAGRRVSYLTNFTRGVAKASRVRSAPVEVSPP